MMISYKTLKMLPTKLKLLMKSLITSLDKHTQLNKHISHFKDSMTAQTILLFNFKNKLMLLKKLSRPYKLKLMQEIHKHRLLLMPQ